MATAEHIAVQRFVKQGGQASGPGGLLAGCGNHILAQFDQGIGAALLQGMAVHGVSGQVAGIGFVVAHGQVGFTLQALKQGIGQAPVAG